MLANISALYNADSLYEQLIAQTIAIESQSQTKLKGLRVDQSILKGILDDFTSNVSSLHTQLGKFTDTNQSPFAARAATVTGDPGLSASATDTAALGEHRVRVDRLARADARLSARFERAGTTLASQFGSSSSPEARSFTLHLAQPEGADPVALSVAYTPAAGATDGDILSGIAAAINSAVATAKADGRLTGDTGASAAVIRETDGTARLSLQSTKSGFGNRLQFSDPNGLLAALDVTNGAVMGSATKTVRTAAQVRGEARQYPLTVTNSNKDFSLKVNGSQINIQLAKKLYVSVDEMAQEMNRLLPASVRATTVDGALQLTTAGTGPATSIQVLDSIATAPLGFTAMAQPVNGTETTTTDDRAGGMLVAVGTDQASSGLSSQFQLNGLTLYRDTNSVSDALDGVTLTLAKANGTEGLLRVGADTGGTRSQIDAFVKTYNATVTFLASKSKIDPDAGTRGVFAGDAAISGLRYGLRSDLSRAVGGAPSLSAIGITTNRDGTLTVSDSAALTDALATKGQAVEALFSGPDGLAERLASRLSPLLGSGGAIASRKAGVDGRIATLDAQIGRWDTRLQRREDSLRAQFNQLQALATGASAQQTSLNSYLNYGYSYV